MLGVMGADVLNLNISPFIHLCARLKVSASNSPLRQAAKRWWQFFDEVICAERKKYPPIRRNSFESLCKLNILFIQHVLARIPVIHFN